MRASSAFRWSYTAALVSVALIALSGCRRQSDSEESRARAALQAGHARYAKQLLERITSRGNASAMVWSDYSAALHADAAPDDMFQLSTALAAADYALDLEPQLPEALFNRAVALEALSLRAAAIKAYEKYLQVAPSSPAASKAGVRLQALQALSSNTDKAAEAFRRVAESEDELFINDTTIAFPQQARLWAETRFLGKWGNRVLAGDSAGAESMLRRCRIIGRALEKHRGDSFLADTVRAIEASVDPTRLAKAHVAYARPTTTYHQSHHAVPKFAESIAPLEEARRLFEADGSPMALKIQHLIAEITCHVGDADRCKWLLRDVSRRTPERHRALRAQIESSSAQFALSGGQHDDALERYRYASAAFTALGEEGSAAAIRDAATALLARTGHTAEAWHLRHTSLVSAADAGDNRRLALTLEGAARDAAVVGRWEVSHALLKAIVETPPFDRQCSPALAWRVVAAHRAGMRRTAAAELRTARVREHPSDDLAIVEALLATDPNEALTLLARPLMFAEMRGDPFVTSQLLVERARLFRVTGQSARERADLERAVALLERAPVRTSSTIRDAMLGTPYRAYSQLADLLDERGETLRALAALESYQARIDLHLRREPQSPAAPRLPARFHTSLPPGTLVVTYGLFADRFVIYTASSLGYTRTTVGVWRSEVEQLVSAFDQAITRDDRLAFENSRRSLTRILITPIAELVANADTLVFVRDPAFSTLPFGALMSRNDGYLIESHAVVVTPGVSSYLSKLRTRTTTPGALLSVGNSLSREPSLSGAESEAREIAATYPSRAMLLGADATKERVLGALPYCDAAHLAVHANAGLGEVIPPHLVLAKTADDEGNLTAAEIAALPLDHVRTVVLAGCRTAISSPGQFGTNSLVNAFLAAGAGSVVGTLWDVEDGPTRHMSILFHRELRKGSTPAVALRRTQIEMIERAASPRVWAALQLYGSGT